jgi:hypothetical protein
MKCRAVVRDRCTMANSIKEMIFPIDGPNGIGLAPGDTRLYAAQTFEGRVWQWDMPRPGELARVVGQGGPLLAGPGGGKLLAGLPGYQLLDSLAVDSAGNVCVATLINGWDYGDLARWCVGGVHSYGRSSYNEYLFWRPGSANGVYYPYRHREAGGDGLAPARVETALHVLKE